MAPISYAAGHIVSAIRKQRVKERQALGLSALFLFFSVKDPHQWNDATPGVALPISWISSFPLEPSNGPDLSSQGGSVTAEPSQITFSIMTLQCSTPCVAQLVVVSQSAKRGLQDSSSL